MDERDREIADLRRRLEALEAEKAAAATSASAPPPTPAAPFAAASVGDAPSYPVKPPAQKKPVWPWFVGGLALVMVVAALSNQDTVSGSAGSNAAAGADDWKKDLAAADKAAADMKAAAATEAPAAAAADPDGAWIYFDRPDEMSGGVTRFACIDASNEVALDFPYKTQKLQLCLRRSPKFGFDAYIELPSGGQFVCTSYDGCTTKVRIDDGAIQAYSMTTPSDHSSDVLFFSNASRLSTALKGAKRLRVDVEYYQAGTQTADFDVDKFDASKLSAAKAN